MMNRTLKGYMLGTVAAACYGVNPVFALPMYKTGIQTDSILFYRYALSFLLMALFIKHQGISLSIKRKEILPLFVMGVLYSCSSLFLFLSYRHMNAGIASTLLFVYPVLVMLITSFFFHEKPSYITIGAVAIVVTGVFLLYNGEGKSNLIGFIFVLISALTYALYMVGVNFSALREMETLKLTFYVLFFGSLIYVIRLRGCIDLQPLTTNSLWIYALALAIVPTIISLLFMIQAIQLVGALPTAVLGALEPITAVILSCLFLNESLTTKNICGICIIVFAVSLVIAEKQIQKHICIYLNALAQHTNTHKLKRHR
ncbi:MAG: EamA family transporter [Bacteroidaceae bacterium]|nr:EamA family transporter [Bacteroidaceae bacterium]